MQSLAELSAKSVVENKLRTIALPEDISRAIHIQRIKIECSNTVSWVLRTNLSDIAKRIRVIHLHREFMIDREFEYGMDGDEYMQLWRLYELRRNIMM
jgi:hypothetical protein